MRLVKTKRVEIEVFGGIASFKLGQTHGKGDICVIVVSGPDVSSRISADSDPILSRIMQNEGLLKTTYSDRVCYISKESIKEQMMSLADAYIAGIVIGDEKMDIEEAVSSVEQNVSSFDRIRSDRVLLQSVCLQWYGKLKMPLLLFYLCLLLVNYYCYPSVERKYEERLKLLADSQRRTRIETEVTERQKQLMTEYMNLSSHYSAYLFDKIGSCVPGGIRLTLLSRESGVFRIKGETLDASSVVFFANHLGDYFKSVKIQRYDIIQGREANCFEIIVSL